MNKDIIKKHLNSTFLSEDKKPVGLDVTQKAQAQSKKSNKEYQSEVGKKMTDYDKASKTDEKKNADSVKKYENNKEQEEYHDDYETLNGQEMIKFDNEPSDSFKERAVKAIEGHASMGNGPGANAEATWGASSDTFGKDLIKRVKSRVKKQDDAMQYDGMGDVAIPRGKNKRNKSVAVAESTENKLESKNKKMKRLKFKNAFNGVGNALQLIPESYKVDNKTFQMTDGNENYEIRWEGTVNEGKAVILKAEDKNMVSENMKHMKHLMGYKSQDTLGVIKGSGRLNENSAFADIFAKTKSLLEGKIPKDVLIENSTPNKPNEVKPGKESGYAKAEGPMVMKEEGDDEEELNEYGNPTPMDRGLEITDNNALIKMIKSAVQKAPALADVIMKNLGELGSAAGQAIRRESDMNEYGNKVPMDRGLEITDNNALIKMIKSAVQKAPELISVIADVVSIAGSAAGQAIRREGDMNEYGNPTPMDRGLEITDNNALIKMIKSAVQKAPELADVIMKNLGELGSAAGQAIRREGDMNEYGNPTPMDRGLEITDNNALIKAVMSAVQKAPALGQAIMSKLGELGSAAGQAIRKEGDRFDEVFEGVNEELSDEQSEEMDTDKDGDIDAKDLSNLRNK